MSPHRPKILLADDSVTIRKVVELTFADEGIDVYSVADSEAAMNAFVADQPDLVIADVNMPGVGGYKICEIIKEDDSTRHIPVILLTGSFEPFDPGEASRVGANFYFTKPFQSIRELVEKVTDLLDTNAFEQDKTAETEDIESLYKNSFSDTLEMPPDEALPGADLIRIKDDDEPDEWGIGPEHVAEPVDAVPESLQATEVSATVLDEELSSGGRDPVDGVVSVEAALAEGPIAADPFAAPADLGDTSMDDEMIETTRPDEPADDIHFRDTIKFEPILVGSALESPSDPFTSPVTTDDSMAKYDWAGESEGMVEQDQDVGTSSNLLRLEFADNDHDAGADRIEIRSDLSEVGASTEDPAVESKPESISPELIELIAQRVIDRLSDKVVREVALEAVPRITESLIREALEHETKK